MSVMGKFFTLFIWTLHGLAEAAFTLKRTLRPQASEF